MDLGNLDTVAVSEKGATLYLTHPDTGEPLHCDDGTPMTIEVLGMDSKTYRNKVDSLQNKRWSSGRMRMTAQRNEVDAVEILASCTITWNIQLRGNKVEPSPDNYRQVYKNPGLRWLRDQVDNFMGDRANFLPPPPVREGEKMTQTGTETG